MELKANELRLNNFVTLNHKVREELFHNKIHAQNEYFEVLTIYSDGDILLKLDDENVELDVKEIEPIPITEEWLLKFGFEKDLQVDLLRLQNELGIIVYYTENSVEKSKINFMLKNTCFMINTIKYVHELQNLYFALTNKELEIKM